MKKIELLLPAKNLMAGIAAIDHGADAVYIGAEKYGARVAASNSLDDIAKLVDYAHQYYAKVYVTVNTIIYENELKNVENLIKDLYAIGVDAIIIQDMAILMMDIPKIPIHLSTQAHNYNLDKIKFFDKVGIDRIVLAREISLNQLKEISSSIKAEIEYFIHGALCVSFSGQCYFSYAITNKSANRGECSQPCRMKYNLIDENGKKIITNKHLLSLKDLNLANYLETLIDAGVSSFKIEGRLKDIDYVKNTTAFYRKEIDKILDNKKINKYSSGVVYHDFIPVLEKTFNRTFTNYFVDDKRKELANFDTPKSLGEMIGKIKAVDNKFIVVENSNLLNNGDGICFLDKNRELVGFYINKIVDDKIYIPDNIKAKVGSVVYRNYDKEFVNLLSKPTAKRKIQIYVVIKYNEPNLVVEIIDEDGNKISFEQNINYEKSNNNTQKEYFNQQFAKLGNTIFEIKDINNQLPDDLFVPARVIKKIKNDCIQKLNVERKMNYPKLHTSYDKNLLTQTDFKFAKYLNYSYNVSNSLAEKFYKLLGAEIIEPAFELQDNFQSKLLMTTKYCIKYEIKKCPKHFADGDNKNLYLENNGKIFKLEFDCKNCEMKIYYEK